MLISPKVDRSMAMVESKEVTLTVLKNTRLELKAKKNNLFLL